MPLLWLKLGGVLAILLGLYGGYKWIEHQGVAKCEAAQAVLQAAADAKAREIERNWEIAAQAAEQEHANEIASINDRHARIVAGLRSRLSRPTQSQTPAPTCTGATGASLFAEDGAFLAGEAARADRIRADLETCKAWIRAVTTVP